jgi:hypothetical protein
MEYLLDRDNSLGYRAIRKRDSFGVTVVSVEVDDYRSVGGHNVLSRG